MDAKLKVLSHAEIDVLVAQARAEFAEFKSAADLALRPRRSMRRTNHLMKAASEAAMHAAAEVPILTAELVREADEVDSLHRHMVVAIREECRQARRADAAEADAAWLQGEVLRLSAQVTQLRAELDQANAALRDREVTS